MTLQRKTPLRAKPRSKGNRGELAVIELLRTYGWSPRRNWQSGGQGGGDILGGPVGCNIEVKHHERPAIWEWIAQAEADARATDIPIVVCRRNRMQWWAVMPDDEFAALLELTKVRTHTLWHRSQRCALWSLLEDVQARANGSEIPVLNFARSPGAAYAAAPATVVFGLLWERECA